MIKRYLLILFFPFLLFSTLSASIYVSDSAELKKAISESSSGGTIILKAGLYSDVDLNIFSQATEESPLIIRSEKLHEAVITGRSTWEIQGRYVQLEGLAFKGLEKGRINVTSSEYTRISQCYFLENKTRSIITISKGGQHNRVDHCIFEKNPAISINVIAGRELIFPVHTRIDHNRFSDVPLIERRNGRETIKIGARPYLNGSTKGYVRVEYNKFIRCNGEPEVISNKISSNIFRQNEFEDCMGELVIRGGHDCVIIGNSFKNNSGGIRLSGSGHLVLNNVISGSTGTDLYKDVPNTGTGVRLVYGADIKDPAFYFAVSDCLIAHNTISGCKDVALEIGSLKGRDLVKTSIKKDKEWDVNKFGEKKFLEVSPFKNKILNNRFYATDGALIRNVESPDNLFESNYLSLPKEGGLGWGSLERNFISDKPFIANTGRSFETISTRQLFDLSEWIGGSVKQVGAFSLDSAWEDKVIEKWLYNATL